MWEGRGYEVRWCRGNGGIVRLRRDGEVVGGLRRQGRVGRSGERGREV